MIFFNNNKQHEVSHVVVCGAGYVVVIEFLTPIDQCNYLSKFFNTCESCHYLNGTIARSSFSRHGISIPNTTRLQLGAQIKRTTDTCKVQAKKHSDLYKSFLEAKSSSILEIKTVLDYLVVAFDAVICYYAIHHEPINPESPFTQPPLQKLTPSQITHQQQLASRQQQQQQQVIPPNNTNLPYRQNPFTNSDAFLQQNQRVTPIQAPPPPPTATAVTVTVQQYPPILQQQRNLHQMQGNGFIQDSPTTITQNPTPPSNFRQLSPGTSTNFMPSRVSQEPVRTTNTHTLQPTTQDLPVNFTRPLQPQAVAANAQSRGPISNIARVPLRPTDLGPNSLRPLQAHPSINPTPIATQFPAGNAFAMLDPSMLSQQSRVRTVVSNDNTQQQRQQSPITSPFLKPLNSTPLNAQPIHPSDFAPVKGLVEHIEIDHDRTISPRKVNNLLEPSMLAVTSEDSPYGINGKFWRQMSMIIIRMKESKLLTFHQDSCECLECKVRFDTEALLFKHLWKEHQPKYPI